MNNPTEALPESALVELSPGTAAVFGRVPDGLELIPFRLVPPEDRAELVAAINTTSPVLGAGENVTDQFSEPKGLVQMAPEFLGAWRPLLRPSPSGDYFDKTWHTETSRSQTRWLPAPQNTPSVVLSRLDLAAPMLSIQTRLDVALRYSRHDVALADSALEAARPEEWEQLWSQSQAVTEALHEATASDTITPKILDRYLKDEPTRFGQTRDQYKARLQELCDRWDDRWPEPELVQFVDEHAEEALLDLHAFLIAHSSHVGYLALRAGRARLGAQDNPQDRGLLNRITSDILDAHTEMLAVAGRALNTLDFSRVNWHLLRAGEPDYAGASSELPEWNLVWRQLDAAWRKLASV